MNKKVNSRKSQYVCLLNNPLLKGYYTAKSRKDKEECLHAILAASKEDPFKATTDALVTCLKPGSCMSAIVKDFQLHSSIPIQLPFWTTIAMAGQKLAQDGGYLSIGKTKIIPTNYYLILADSGEFKTTTLKLIKAGFEEFVLNELMTPQSVAGMLQGLVKWCKENKPVLWIKDEFGAAFARWTSDRGGNAQIGELLLEAYNHGTIRLALKEEAYEIPGVDLSVLAYSQTKLFHEHFRPQDFQSGLVQRFTIVNAPMRDDPRLDAIDLEEKLEQYSLPYMRKVLKSQSVGEYTIEPKAFEYIRHQIQEVRRQLGIEKGFAVRTLYNTWKWAMILHYLNGRDGMVVDMEDAIYAVQMAKIVMSDLRVMLDQSKEDDIGGLIRKCIEAKKKLDMGMLKGSWTKSWISDHVRPGGGRQWKEMAGVLDLVWELTNIELDEPSFTADEVPSLEPIGMPKSNSRRKILETTKTVETPKTEIPQVIEQFTITDIPALSEETLDVPAITPEEIIPESVYTEEEAPTTNDEEIVANAIPNRLEMTVEEAKELNPTLFILNHSNSKRRGDYLDRYMSVQRDLFYLDYANKHGQKAADDLQQAQLDHEEKMRRMN